MEEGKNRRKMKEKFLKKLGCFYMKENNFGFVYFKNKVPLIVV